MGETARLLDRDEALAEARDFISEFSERLRAATVEAATLSWKVATAGEEADAQELARCRKAVDALYDDPDAARRVHEWSRAIRDEDPYLERQLVLLERGFEASKSDRAMRAEIIEREAELDRQYCVFRGSVDGRSVSNSDIEAVLQSSDDSAERQSAWEAFSSIGAAVRDDVIGLVCLRNKQARTLGYRDFYAWKMEAQELDESEVFGILARLEKLTRNPFRTRKAVVDAGLSKRFGVDVGELMPWHYSDPFFQRSTGSASFDLNAFYENEDLSDLTVRFYDGIGMNVRDVMARSDLEPRAGKSQHGFCIDIDREGDIRVLCNVRPCERWMDTMLHEFGHASYDRYIDRKLPWFLRRPAHTLMTEAVALMMGRFSKDPDFLIEYAGADHGVVSPRAGELRRQQRFAMLTFVRWTLVMTHFERALYANPERDDLDDYWWELREKYQLVKRPEGRKAPDWASKLHLALAPVYYHNYLLGELVASQLLSVIAARCGDNGMVDNLYAGEFLITKVFAPGASLRWDRLLEDATGERLDVMHFARSFVSPG